MADWLEEQLHQAMVTLRDQRDRIESAKAELAARRATVTSADRMVSVTVDANNAVVGLKFNTSKYRDMHPEQLAHVLVDVLGRARAQMADAAVEVFGPLVDERTDLRAAMAGGGELDAAFAAIWDEAPSDAFGRRRS
ncbi:YbaB/EbfC family nucleoid-associated protein [Nocardia sp. NRRL S-836]|uniref:YbaB/EbfC family nucleoid-associated protein n=1 Tax=Nocardia sp. NRRL S-836 TaxID=1519492 RepID=UPI0018D022A8|nr:YbaB/EbfC family nucleoid-associated protein [Nocardia sp. NRRL S-836]